MKTIKKSNNVTRIDELNIGASKPFKAWEEKMAIRAAMIVEDEDGKQYSYIFTADGDTFAGNSESIRKAVDGLIDVLNDSDEILYGQVNKAKSKNDKEFYTMSFSE